MIRRMGLRRYHQNHAVDRARRGISYARGSRDFGGISELWIEDLDSLNAAFASEAGWTLMVRATEFISGISTFLVEPYELV